jgi:hypothetical protein
VARTPRDDAVLRGCRRDGDDGGNLIRRALLLPIVSRRDRLIQIRIPLGLFISSLFYKSFRDTSRLRVTKMHHTPSLYSL